MAATGEADRAVVEAAQRGALWAQDELVSSYLPLVYNIVGRALNGHADVDDVVQESMLRALRGLRSLKDPLGFRSWLVAITMNQIRTYWSKQQAAPSDLGLQDAYEVADPGADFVDLTIVRLGLEGQRREVAQATRWLDTDDRALLSLWWLEAAGELSRAEVAAALEMSPQHTGVRVQRMKAQLETARLVVRALSATPLCARLDQVTDNWDRRPSALWRKRIARHARECGVCWGHQAGLVPAEGLLVGLGLVPVAAALTGTGALAALYGADSVEPTAFSAHGDTATPSESGDATAVPRAVHDADPHGRHRVQRVQRVPEGSRHSRRVQERIRRRRRTTGLAAAVAALLAGGSIAAVNGLPSDEDGHGDTVRSAADSESASPPSPTASPSPSRSKSHSPEPRATHKKPKPKSAPAKTKSAPPRPRPTPTPTAADPADTPAEQVLAIVNKERAKAGCRPLKLDDRLTRAAQLHSEDMSAKNYFDHTSQDGRSFSDRAKAQGYQSPGAENIARGQNSPEDVMAAWMNSEGHRANILNCDLTTMGLGLVEDDRTWTQLFGS
ncbi:sigma-70 family RNA polymerase sigma factor [Streptomyces sp. CA-250714]|uniref:sigma-70 family RNA polymerase sigma factor n=1 Tax=Streptomyces sp. CA-250714 TaxID=3240060 RepID=UPI003D909727